MNWLLFAEIIYVLIIILVCLRIIYDTKSPTKTSAYILLVIFLPLIGLFIYFSFGVNYRKRKMYCKSIFAKELENRLKNEFNIAQNELLTIHTPIFDKYEQLVKLVFNKSFSPVSANNEVQLLSNGEHKFPEVLRAIKNAEHHIHLEYYIFDPDDIGMQIIDLLIEKAIEGVKVRFIYDDFGSRGIKKKHLVRMREAGVEVYPFYKIIITALASRMNYRNHRKIIVIDGEIGFVGGINVSDKYINNPAHPDRLFWRDTHLMLKGEAVRSLQYVFLGDWNYCSNQQLQPDHYFFPKLENKIWGQKLVQMVFSGPDSDSPLIQQSLCKAINLAKEEVLITSPYVIPGETIMETLIMSSQSGIAVKLLVPEISDSLFINMANHNNFGTLLDAGVEIYTYQKGFIHAKTLVIDREIAIVGTANMDLRSFDLNFEINSIVYDKELALELHHAFYEDIQDAKMLEANMWRNRPKYRQLLDKVVGLLSPLL